MTRINSKSKLLFLLVIFACLFSACSQSGQSPAREEVFINDKTKTPGNEIVITDTDVKIQKALSQNEKKEDFETAAPDGSKIATAFDSFGNKSETRCFNNSRIKCLHLLTHADGTREAQVFGHNGLTRNLPEAMLDRATTASADEIADSVRIYAPFKATRPLYKPTAGTQTGN